jgi:hypothetical protein
MGLHVAQKLLRVSGLALAEQIITGSDFYRHRIMETPDSYNGRIPYGCLGSANHHVSAELSFSACNARPASH